MSTRLEPLRFERRFFEKVWGGRALERRPGIALPPEISVGETWEIVDREGENSIVAEGAFRGRSLRELMGDLGGEILGEARAGKEGRFPLLVKYIDASQNLSVQVHPDERAAKELGNAAEAKTEAWYVLDVAPAGRLYAGLKPAVRAPEFARVAAGPDVLEMLQRWEVRPGECLLVPGGTVHAIGAGVTILEVQENSDTTYRLWDWGRVGRETHVDQALACIRFGEPARPPIPARWTAAAPGLRRAPLARSELFEIEILSVTHSARMPPQSRFQIYAAVEGSGKIAAEDRSGSWTLDPGDVWLLPASFGPHTLESSGDELRIVRVSSPR